MSTRLPPKKPPKSGQTFMLPDALMDQVRKIAVERGRSIRELVQIGLEIVVEMHEKEKQLSLFEDV